MYSFGQKLRMLREEHRKTQAEVAAATGIKQAAISSYERDCYMPNAVNLRALCDYFNVSVSDLDERFAMLDQAGESVQPPKTADTIRNTPELRECIKDAMLRRGITDAADLKRLIGYDSLRTLERLLAGKLNWFPDVLSAVLAALEIDHDSVPISPSERMLLLPRTMFDDGAILVRPIPVVDWANAADYVSSLTAGTNAVSFRWDPATTETVPAPMGMRRGTVALRVSGQSMEPRIQDGDRLFCEPVSQLSDIASNKVVVVRFSDTYAPCPGCIVCKRLKRFGNTICLISDNDGGRAFDDIKPSDFTWLGVVVGKYSDDF